MVVLKALLLVLLLFGSNHDAGEGFRFLFAIPRYDLVSFYTGIWALALVWLVTVAFAPDLGTRILGAAPFVLFGLLADIHYEVLHVPLSIDQVEAYRNMRFWAGDAIGMYGGLMLWPSLRALACLLLVAAPPVLPRLRVRRLAILPVLGILAVVSVVYRTGGYGIQGLPAQFSTPGPLGVFATYDLALGERESVLIPQTSRPAVTHMLLVVDESIRGDFVHLRPGSIITPYLAAAGSRVISFGIATAGNNCTQSSNAILPMGANPDRLGRQGDNLLTHPTIWKYARAASYETWFVDAQATRGILINYMNPRERKLIDHVIQIESSAAYEKDREAARRVREILRSPRPQFIYLNKMGAHFPYERAAPPDVGLAATPSNPAGREGLLASYRRAVRWSVDGFFEVLLSGPDLRDVVVMYTSEHGQNLREDGDSVTHCRETPTVYEAMVPLLVLTDNPALPRRFATAAVRNENRASYFQLFPTILALLGFDLDAVRREYYFTLFDDVPARLGITSGAVFGRFGKLPKWTVLPERVSGPGRNGQAGLPGQYGTRGSRESETAAPRDPVAFPSRGLEG